MASSSKTFHCLILMVILNLVCGVKILGIFPIPSRSHMAVNIALMKELARRGHEVTVLTPYPSTESIPNYNHIKIIEVDLFKQADNENMFELTVLKGFVSSFTFLWDMGNNICEHIFPTDELQKIIHSKDLSFDLFVAEAFNTDCLVGFAHRFKVPLVQTCSFDGAGWISAWVGNPHPLAYVPDGMNSFTDKMSFTERLWNTVSELMQIATREIYFIPQQNSIMRKYLNHSVDLPHLSDILRSTSLVLLNNHFSTSYPKPLTPNMVQVGGMHIESPKKLPKDIQDYLDISESGVIYFSMGSTVKGSDMPEARRKIFMEVFSKLKQNVLWKWETDSLPGKPKNVKLGKWLPQSDILAHPNVKLFISHGGLLSFQETTHRGVPVIGVPVFADQKLNVMKAAASGYGILLELENITVESLSWAVHEILDHPSYQENARRYSKIFRDQPLTPLQQAVYWTEYVIRHKGAPHMRSAALDLTWYQYFLLDVIAVLLLCLGLVLGSVLVVFRFILRRCLRRSNDINLKKERDLRKKKN